MGYAFDGLAQVELAGLVYDCSGGVPEELVQVAPRLLPNTPLVNSTLVTGQLRSPGQNCEFHADAMLEFMGLMRPIGMTIGILLSYLCVVHLCTFAALIYVSRRAEKR